MKRLSYCFQFKPVLHNRFTNFTRHKIKHSFPQYLLLLTACISILSLNTLGQSKAETSESPIGGAFYMGIPYSMFKNDSKHIQGINDCIGLLSLGFDLVFGNIFILGNQIGWDSPKDEKKFTNQTTIGELSSSVSIWNYSFSGGLKIPDIYFSEEKTSFTFASLSFGNMWAFFEKRSIETCIDCDREEVDIDGGLFIQPELYYVYGILGLGISYRYFFYSDYRAKAEFKIGLVFS